MNITQRPVFQKTPKEPSDPEYLRDVRGLPCCICEAFGMIQQTPTEAHHPFVGRYSTAKAPDGAAIPLCRCHHTGSPGSDKIAIHRGKAEFVQAYGSDWDFVDVTRDKIDAQRGLGE